MDEKSNRLKPDLSTSRDLVAPGTIDRKRESAGGDGEEDKEHPAVEISRLRTEIDATRDELGTYVSELDRRRHEALDLKHQVKKHPGLAIGAGVAILGAVAGAVVMVIRARRPATRARTRQRKLKRGASPSPETPRDPRWLVKLLLRAALPVGIALVKRRLGQGSNRRPPAA